MRAPNMAGAGSQALEERRGRSQAASPALPAIPKEIQHLLGLKQASEHPAAFPQTHEEMNTHPAASLVRTGHRWQMTSHPGSPLCRGEVTGGQSCCDSSIWPSILAWFHM